MILIGGIILGIYLVSMGLLLFGYRRIKEFKFDVSEKKTTPLQSFSVIIPFRNEAKNLPDLLASISKLKYPRENFEVIFIDDESKDDSVEIILRKLNDSNVIFRIINNVRTSASPKKDAISEAIKISKYEWIITTDADCLLPKNWLVAFDNFISKNNPIMIAGPVNYSLKNDLINQYQQLDNFSLQTTTVGAFGWKHPILCNGANLAYKKEEFNLVLGFLNNNHIASGDDIFLLEKFRSQHPKKVQFIKSRDSIVLTKAQGSWKNIINQRIRWASKTSKQKGVFSKLLGLVVFLSNLMVLIGLFLSVINLGLISYFISFLLIKTMVDFLILYPTSTFFKRKINVPFFLINTLIYPIITIVVVVKSLQGKYIWKGRTIN